MSSNNESHAPAAGTSTSQEEEGDNNPTNGNQQRQTKTTNRRPARNRDGNADTKAFKGETGKMNGHVFQTHAERKDKSQFEDTMEALRIYASSAYKNDIESMTILFTELKNPIVIKPDDPEETISTDADGKETKVVSRFTFINM